MSLSDLASLSKVMELPDVSVEYGQPCILEFRADQMYPRNLGSQINISMRPTRIDKTNIPSMRKV